VSTLTDLSNNMLTGSSSVLGLKNSKVPLIPYWEFSLPIATLRMISLNDQEIGLHDFANPIVACLLPHDSLNFDVSQR
jgi:hypothetical protein